MKGVVAAISVIHLGWLEDTCHVVSQNRREVEGSEWAGELLSAKDQVSTESKLFVKMIWAEPRGGSCLWAVLGRIKLHVIIPKAANYDEKKWTYRP